jgi:hypothetical protein
VQWQRCAVGLNFGKSLGLVGTFGKHFWQALLAVSQLTYNNNNMARKWGVVFDLYS